MVEIVWKLQSFAHFYCGDWWVLQKGKTIWKMKKKIWLSQKNEAKKYFRLIYLISNPSEAPGNTNLTLIGKGHLDKLEHSCQYSNAVCQ